MAVGVVVHPAVEAAPGILPDGTQILVRPIAPSDADALQAFHAGLSRQTVYNRFFWPHGALSQDEVEYFTHVDQQSRVALAAFSADRLIAVARYDRVPGTTDAEVAFVVTDDWQGRGVGRLLMTRLTTAAQQSGVRRFVADTLISNTRMLKLLRELGPTRTEGIDQGCAHVVVNVPVMSGRPA